MTAALSLLFTIGGTAALLVILIGLSVGLHLRR